MKNLTRTLNVFVDKTSRGVEKAELRREKLVGELIKELQPDFVILWSGNFHYQKGTLSALREHQLLDRTLFSEVAWFSQKEFLYFDRKGVNAFSSLPGFAISAFTLEPAFAAKCLAYTLRPAEVGRSTGPCKSTKIFVPLQVDTDTSIVKSSPFKSMNDFIGFLERWVPEEFEVTIKLHPKARYPYLPASRREKFKVIAGGVIEQYLHDADTVH